MRSYETLIMELIPGETPKQKYEYLSKLLDNKKKNWGDKFLESLNHRVTKNK